MSWLLLALSLAVFCVAWSVHSPALMVLCMLAALAALGGFAWLRYKLLFPERSVAIDDTPLTVEDVRRMRDAQAVATDATSLPPLPAASRPDANQIRAAAQRVAERVALIQQPAAGGTPSAPAEPAPAAALPPALPRKPQPNLRDEGWNPYAGEVHVPAKQPVDPGTPGLTVPMLTPLRDEPDPT
ncbi:MAG: hypothetical protein JF567_10535 [Xanthomonadales bacterium]|nr:hypothetical protein [Xanthomonadales bacterium]